MLFSSLSSGILSCSHFFISFQPEMLRHHNHIYRKMTLNKVVMNLREKRELNYRRFSGRKYITKTEQSAIKRFFKCIKIIFKALILCCKNVENDETEVDCESRPFTKFVTKKYTGKIFITSFHLCFIP